MEKHTNAIFSKLGLTEEEDVNRRVKAVLIYLRADAPEAGPTPGRATPGGRATSLSLARLPVDRLPSWTDTSRYWSWTTRLPSVAAKAVVRRDGRIRRGGRGHRRGGGRGHGRGPPPGPGADGHQHAGDERGGGHPPDRGHRARHRGDPVLHLHAPGPPPRRLTSGALAYVNKEEFGPSELKRIWAERETIEFSLPDDRTAGPPSAPPVAIR